MSNELFTLAVGALPILESRIAIPIGLGFGFSPLKAYLFGISGTILLTLPLLVFWKHYVRLVMKHFAFSERYFNWIFDKTRHKHKERFETFGFFALVLFTAIPFPGTGAYSASIVAFLFEYPFWKSFFAILLGVLLAGALVLLASLGIINIF